jgi:hypothetical protein
MYVKNITSEKMKCAVGVCPAIFDTAKDYYLIIGEIADPKQYDLVNKIGKNEVLIKISKKIIDEKKI